MKINDELDAGAHAPEMLDKVGEQEYIVILRAHLVPAGVYAAGTRRPPTVTVIRLQIDLAVRQQLDVQLHNHALGAFVLKNVIGRFLQMVVETLHERARRLCLLLPDQNVAVAHHAHFRLRVQALENSALDRHIVNARRLKTGGQTVKILDLARAVGDDAARTGSECGKDRGSREVLRLAGTVIEQGDDLLRAGEHQCVRIGEIIGQGGEGLLGGQRIPDKRQDAFLKAVHERKPATARRNGASPCQKWENRVLLYHTGVSLSIAFTFSFIRYF